MKKLEDSEDGLNDGFDEMLFMLGASTIISRATKRVARDLPLSLVFGAVVVGSA
jgi:hypothetical protein